MWFPHSINLVNSLNSFWAVFVVFKYTYTSWHLSHMNLVEMLNFLFRPFMFTVADTTTTSSSMLSCLTPKKKHTTIFSCLDDGEMFFQSVYSNFWKCLHLITIRLVLTVENGLFRFNFIFLMTAK